MEARNDVTQLCLACFRSENRFPLFRKHSIGRQAHRARSTTTRDQVTWCIGGGLKVSYAPYACQLVGRIFLPLRNEYAALLPWRHRRYGNVRRRRRTADSYENLTDNFCKRTPITGLRRHSTPHRLRSRQTHGHNSTRHNSNATRRSLTVPLRHSTLRDATARKYAETFASERRFD